MKKSSNKNSRDNNFLTAKRIEEIMSELGYKKNIEFFNIIVIETIIYQFNNIINIGI